MRPLVALLLLPAISAAQAWINPPGDGTVSVFYQYNVDRLHAFTDGRTKDKGHTYYQAAVISSDFSFTDRLAVSLTLPFVQAKYLGSSPHLITLGNPATAVGLDDGSYHGGFQDFGLNVRYALTRGSWKITPLFQATWPSNHYPSFGHASIGFDEQEYRAGVNVGRRLDPLLPKAFIQAQYAFGMTPLVAANIAPKRSYGELQLGYLLSRHLTLQGSSVLTWSHNGIQVDYDQFPNNLTTEQYLNHDRIAQTKALDAGGTVAYQINRSTNVFVSLGHSFYGTNGHLRFLATTFGFTKAFSTNLGREYTPASAVLQDPNKAVVCTCARTR